MSETTPLAAVPVVHSSDSLTSPQSVIAIYGLTIVAGTVAGVFLKGDTATLQLVVGVILGTFGGGIIGFYFGSSKGSQDKDRLPPHAAPLP